MIDLAGHKTVLSSGFGSVQGMVWHSPDEIWFTATRTGTSRELYAVTLAGKERQILSAPSNLMLQDISPKGTLLMVAENHRDGVLGVAPGETREKELAWFNWSIARDITPDGKTLLIEEEGDAGGLNYLIYLRGTDGSPALRLGEGQAMSISPDRKWVLSRMPGSGNPLRILPIGTGEARDITHGERDYPGGRWVDNKHILAVGIEPGHGPRNYLLDIDGGQPRAVTPEGTRGTVLSQDARSVIVRNPDGKPLIWSLDGGEPKPVAGVGEHENVIAWLADGLLYVTPSSGPDALPRKIFALNPLTGARQLWKTLAPADLTGITSVSPPRISADGRAYAYTYARSHADLYLVDGVK